MKLTILGNGAGGPYQGRNYTSQILQVENQFFLIDCGEGAQHQLYRYKIPYDRIQQVFISHLHGDHVFGLIGLLTSFCLKKRSKKIEFFSPAGLREMIEHTASCCGVTFPYPLEFNVVDPAVSAPVFENKHLEVWTIPLLHRIACSGWLFREKPKPRNIRREKIEEYAIPIHLIPGIKSGANLSLPDGRIVPNTELTLPPRPLRSYAFCSDTAPSDLVADAVRGVDLLYHESTFTDEHTEEARLSCHSTARQAGAVAQAAGVKKLLLGHFSGRYPDSGQHVSEARDVFAESYPVSEGETYSV